MANIQKLSDEEIREKYKTMSKRQICKTYQVGIQTIRRVTRENNLI